MMRELAQTARLAKMMVDAVKLPVTAKMRLGWDEQNITAPDLARALEEVGVAAITVHGRTRAQGFSGSVDLAGIQAVVQAAKGIPVIGNGDVTTPQAAKKMFAETGCAAISIGRGAFYNPWIFGQTLRYFQTGELSPEPSFEGRVRVMCRHLDFMIEVFGEGQGCRMFRKIAPWYAKRFGPAREFNRGVTTISSRAEFQAILADYADWRRQFLDETGALQPRYQPAPLAASFMRQTSAASASHVPVPKGPVEWW
jgi:nifR3 family TIM-barrel protein